MNIFKDKRIILIFVAFVIIGIALMSYNNTNSVEKISTTIEAENSDSLEEKMSEILSDVKGAGNVRVMITYKAGSEKIIAYNSDNEKNNETFTTKERNEAVVDNEGPFVLKEIYPEIEGVLILAEGGEDTNVKNNLINAGKVLLGVEVNKIEVLVMKKEA